MAGMQDLPAELIAHISSYLNFQSLASLARTCKGINGQASWTLYRRDAMRSSNPCSTSKPMKAIIFGVDQDFPRTIIQAAEAGSDLHELYRYNAIDKYNLCAKGRTPLFLAVEYSHLEAVRTLLGLGANVLDVDKYKKTLLHVCRDPQVLILLLETDCRTYVNARTLPLLPGPLTPLGYIVSIMWPARATSTPEVAENPDYCECAKQLLTYGADPNASCGEMTLLGCAAKHGRNSDFTIVLLSFGADANLRDQWLWSPLFYAIFYRVNAAEYEIVKALLKHNADPNERFSGIGAVEEEQLTPLLAATADHVPATVFRLLLENGADYNAKVKLEKHAWSYGVPHGDEREKGLFDERNADAILEWRKRAVPACLEVQRLRVLKLALLAAAGLGELHMHFRFRRSMWHPKYGLEQCKVETDQDECHCCPGNSKKPKRIRTSKKKGWKVLYN